MLFTDEHRNGVKALIDGHTGGTLDNYTRDTIKTVAATLMANDKDENGNEIPAKDEHGNEITAMDVANAVFDYMYQNLSGDATMAVMCKQICTKDVMLSLRLAVIAALK